MGVGNAAWVVGGVAALAAGLGTANSARAAAALERHVAPGPEAPSAQPLPTPAAPSNDDSRPLGADLKAVVLIGAEDAVPAAAAPGVDASRLPAPDRADLARRLAPFIGKPVSRALIAEVQAAVVLHYRRAGRPLVSVTAPPQEVDQGVLSLRVIPFVLGRKTAAGGSARVDAAVVAGIRARPGASIQSAQLEQDLDWLNRTPFRQVAAAFTPGAALGDTDLLLQVRQSKPWQVTTGYSNSGTPSSGIDRWSLGIQIADLVVPGSTLSYQLTTSDDFWYDHATFGGADDPQYLSHSLVASAPLAPRQDLTVTANYLQSRTDTQDFVTISKTAEASAVYRSAVSNLLPLPGDVSLGVEARAQRTLTYFGGVKVREDAADVGQFLVGWADAWGGAGDQQSLSLTGRFSPGGLSRHNTDADFLSVSNGRAGDTAYAYGDIDYSGAFTIAGAWRYVASVSVQLADRPLIDTEQMAIGGAGGARTYVYDDQSFDSGVVWRNELRAPTLQGPVAAHLPASAAAPYLFADAAYGYDLGGGPRQKAADLGLGLDWSLGGHLSGGVSGGWSLVNAAYTRQGSFKLLASARFGF